MSTDTMHPDVARFGLELLAWTENPIARPSQLDRDKFMILRNRIVSYNDEGLDEANQRDLSGLRTLAIVEAGRQDDFYAANKGWAPAPREQLLAMGPNAPIEELVKSFSVGGLSSFAAKEIPEVRRQLRVRTIGELAARTRADIGGPQCRFAGNKTLEWIAAVCREFGIESPH